MRNIKIDTGGSSWNPSVLLPGLEPAYTTSFGASYIGDSLSIMQQLPSNSIRAVITSPPYALHFKKEYGNVDKGDYVEWFLPFAREIKRILVEDGSFVLNVGGSYNPGMPTRSLYHFRLLIALCDEVGFHLAQECFWYNPAKLPAPAEWVNVRRVRIKDSVEYIWWLSPSPWPFADNRNVLVPYSQDMKRLIKNGFRATKRPSGHNITAKFGMDRGGAIPANLIEDDIPSNLIDRGNNESNSEYIKHSKENGVKVHPARFPAALPQFFIKLLTAQNEIVLDPFAGSNMTGWVAESLERHWISIEIEKNYVVNSALRFGLRLQAEHEQC